MEFGLAGEGITDQVVLRSILTGHFASEEIYDETTFLQPAFDETTRQQAKSVTGGWSPLLTYLASERFRDDVINHDYLLVQIDTDISNEIGFDVLHTDSGGNAKPVSQLVNDVTHRLVAQIEQGQAGFYATHQQKIVFALAVHSLECWLLAHYESGKRATKVVNCFGSLERTLPGKVVKTHDAYQALAAPFEKKKHLTNAAASNESLQLFLARLDLISYP